MNDGVDVDPEIGEDVVSTDLLERARRLCMAANEIALPMLQSVEELKRRLAAKEQANHDAVEDDEERRREQRSDKKREKRAVKNTKPTDKANRSSRQSTATGTAATTTAMHLPLLPSVGNKPVLPTTAGKDRTRSAMARKRSGNEERDAALPLPQIHATDEWRKQREIEKVRQAQERARARLLKSNQVDLAPVPLGVTHPVDRAAESAKMAAAPPNAEDKERMLEEQRRRAEERVRQRKQALQAEREQSAKVAVVPERPEDAKRVEAFRRQTLERVRASKKDSDQAAAAQVEAAYATGPEVNDADDPDAERERKKMEKRRRKETAQRLKRHQQAAIDQQREEQDRFEKGLCEFKNGRKELDRVAKGIPTRSRQPTATTECGVDEKNRAPLQTGHDTSSDQLGAGYRQPTLVSTSPSEAYSDREHSALVPPTATVIIPNDELAEASTGLDIAVDLDQPAVLGSKSTGPETRRRKLPPWKQPPVPIEPAESYSYKAVVSPTSGVPARSSTSSSGSLTLQQVRHALSSQAAPTPTPSTAPAAIARGVLP